MYPLEKNLTTKQHIQEAMASAIIAYVMHSNKTIDVEQYYCVLDQIRDNCLVSVKEKTIQNNIN